MTTGFWISVAFLAVGVAVSLLLLPNKSRETQALRVDDDAESSPGRAEQADETRPAGHRNAVAAS